MFNWLNFFNFFFFFLFFIFLTNAFNIFFLLLTSELMWASLVILTAILGSIIDDSFLISFSFLILGFASVELAIGLILLVYLKTLNLSLNLATNESNVINLNTNFFLKKNNIKKKI
uniref:NADH dehydrogenase subunit 4L n=1 Tax=Paramecium caudatum TaxID=5885 RepID=D8L7U9_PARCA|nr:NADH dehydrogenase subunit 4L [Paramecium caudatum]CAZ66836.1 NADH dehydrogenase subunit 4L [Paramecium caudatum]